MRYAIQKPRTLIIGAADSIAEFDALVTKDSIWVDPAFKVEKAEQASFMDMLQNDDYAGFRKAPFVVSFADEDSLLAYRDANSISIIGRNALIERGVAMLESVIADPYFDETDTRSIAEIHGLDEDDPWDKRTDEEKERDAAVAAKIKDMKSKGEITSDSFGGGAGKTSKHSNDDPLAVTDVTIVRDSDGNIVMGDVKARKGFGESVDHDVHIPLVVEDPETSNDTEYVEIDPNGEIGVYRKIDVTGSKLIDVKVILDAHEERLDKIFMRRNAPHGCWLVTISAGQADRLAGHLIAAGMDVEVYAVNDVGLRIVPKGMDITVVDTSDEGQELPRPWNSRAYDFERQTPEEAEANWKTVSRDEFHIVGEYEGPGRGTVVHIVPSVYFRQHGKMWDEPLNIGHILPPDMIEEAPGIYRSKSRNWEKLSFYLWQSGFKDGSMGLQLHLNELAQNIE